MLFRLYDAIYNKVEEAGLAIQDVVSSATSPDVNKYIDENPASVNLGIKRKKSEPLSIAEFAMFMNAKRASSNKDDRDEAKLISLYRNGELITDKDYVQDNKKAYEKVLKAYGRGKTIFDVIRKEGYTVKLKKDGTWKAKKIKKEKLIKERGDEEFVNIINSMKDAVEHQIIEKTDIVISTILQNCESDDDVDSAILEMAELNKLNVQTDLTDLFMELANPIKNLKKAMMLSSTVDNIVNDEIINLASRTASSDNTSEPEVITEAATTDFTLVENENSSEKPSETVTTSEIKKPVVPKPPKNTASASSKKKTTSKKDASESATTDKQQSDEDDGTISFADAAGIKVD